MGVDRRTVVAVAFGAAVVVAEAAVPVTRPLLDAGIVGVAVLWSRLSAPLLRPFSANAP